MHMYRARKMRALILPVSGPGTDDCAPALTHIQCMRWTASLVALTMRGSRRKVTSASNLPEPVSARRRPANSRKAQKIVPHLHDSRVAIQAGAPEPQHQTLRRREQLAPAPELLDLTRGDVRMRLGDKHLAWTRSSVLRADRASPEINPALALFFLFAGIAKKRVQKTCNGSRLTCTP